MLRPEPFLERVERAVRGLHPLDRRDARAVGLDREHRAALDRLAVDRDGAGAALARVAADVGAGQLEVLAQELDEHPSRLDVPLPRLAIDGERDVLDHGWSLLPRDLRESGIGGQADGVRVPLSMRPGMASMVNRPRIGCKAGAHGAAARATSPSASSNDALAGPAR